MKDTRYGRRSSKKRSSSGLLLALVLAAVGVGALVWSELGEHVVYFLTPLELTQQASQLGQQEVRVGGMVEVGSLEFDEKLLRSEFVLSDLKSARINVSYVGLLPDMFGEGRGVVVEGKIDEQGQLFSAHTLMVKHSEEYQPPGDHPSMDEELLKRSLLQTSGEEGEEEASVSKY